MIRYTIEHQNFYTIFAETDRDALRQFRVLHADGLLQPEGTITLCERDGLQLHLDEAEVETLRGLLAEHLEGIEDTHLLGTLLGSLYTEER